MDADEESSRSFGTQLAENAIRCGLEFGREVQSVSPESAQSAWAEVVSRLEMIGNAKIARNSLKVVEQMRRICYRKVDERYTCTGIRLILKKINRFKLPSARFSYGGKRSLGRVDKGKMAVGKCSARGNTRKNGSDCGLSATIARQRSDDVAKPTEEENWNLHTSILIDCVRKQGLVSVPDTLRLSRTLISAWEELIRGLGRL